MFSEKIDLSLINFIIPRKIGGSKGEEWESRVYGTILNVVLALEASHRFPCERSKVASDEAFRVDVPVLGKEGLEISDIVVLQAEEERRKETESLRQGLNLGTSDVINLIGRDLH